MALIEITPTLQSLEDRINEIAETLKRTQLTVSERGRTVFEEPPALGDAETLRKVAVEVHNQLRTAERTFTIALVGAFKVGKSTLLNALLGLTDPARLSTEVQPDTACSTLIRYRDQDDPEARLHFANGTVEDVSWGRARQMSSQVWLENNPEDMNMVESLIEIEYFVRNDLLVGMNLNDLPGTGSRYWKEHTELTHEKMKTADAILWVIGEEEPGAADLEDLAILMDCSQSVIPVLNVFENPAIDPPMERDEAIIEEVKASLMRNFRHYFRAGLEPLEVSARVLEIAWEKNEFDTNTIRETGFLRLRELLAHMLEEAGDLRGGTRIRRICGTTISLCGQGLGVLEESRGKTKLAQDLVRSKLGTIEQTLQEIDETAFDARLRIRPTTEEYASKYCSHLISATESFIKDKLSLGNFKGLMTSATSNRDELAKSLEKEFRDRYLKLDQEPNWLAEMMQVFATDVVDIIIPLWRTLIRQAKIGSPTDGEQVNQLPVADIVLNKDDLIEPVIDVALQLIKIAAVAGLLLAIPGGQVIDAVTIGLVLIFRVLHDPLEGPRGKAIKRARGSIKRQHYVVENRLLEAGHSVNRRIKELLVARIQKGDEDIAAIDRAIDRFYADQSAAIEEIKCTQALMTTWLEEAR